MLKGNYQVPALESIRISLPRFNDVSEESAERLVLAGEGLFVNGIAGTGKSFFARGLVEKLREEGKRVCVLAKTHLAVQNMK